MKQCESGEKCGTVCGMNKTALIITLGAMGVITAMGMAAAAVYNSRQMRAARALKRTGKVFYLLGTTMRNLSGLEDLS